MNRVHGLTLLAALAAGVCLGAAAPPPVVHLDAAGQKRLSVTTAPLAAARRAAAATGFARVLDPVPLASLDADLIAAAAAVQASRAEAQRTRALNAADAAVSARVAQAAEAQARADAAKLALLRRRLGLEWGPGLARLPDARRAALVDRIAAGRGALVRIDAPSGQGLAGLRGADLDLGPLGVVHAVVLGPARTADPRLLSPGVIAWVSGPGAAALGPGLTAPALLPGPGPSGGVLVPRAALIRTEGRTWVYVRRGADGFQRRVLIDPAPEAEGLFVASGFLAGEPVAVSGGAALFAAERPSGAAD